MRSASGLNASTFTACVVTSTGADVAAAAAVAALASLSGPLHGGAPSRAGVVMELCGIPRDLFTPTFAVSRCVGWCVHLLEGG